MNEGVQGLSIRLSIQQTATAQEWRQFKHVELKQDKGCRGMLTLFVSLLILLI